MKEQPMEDIFLEILKNARSVDMAEADFRNRLIDDPELKARYKEYCREQGTSEKNGFRDFCLDYIAEEDSIWDELNDYDE